VNLSPCLLIDPGFAGRMCDMVRDEGLTPARLTFDVPDGFAVAVGAGASAEAADTLTKLRLKGFGLSVDDFGFGASSLAQLYRMPFNEMKIDLAFVTDAPGDPEAETICRALVRLAHEFGMTACAEGVETAETLAYLSALGCDMAQGYFIDRPLLADEVALRFGAFVDAPADAAAFLPPFAEPARVAF
ncbi:MAG: EAL domain-containing protein, partial [Alphaproteobacteria bacterium]